MKDISVLTSRLMISELTYSNPSHLISRFSSADVRTWPVSPFVHVCVGAGKFMLTVTAKRLWCSDHRQLRTLSRHTGR